MQRGRVALVILAVVGVLAAAALVWFALASPAATPLPPPPPTNGGADPPAPVDGPVVAPPTAADRRHHSEGVYPWKQYLDAIYAAKHPGVPPDGEGLPDRVGVLDGKLRDHPISVQFEDVTLRGFVEYMNTRVAETGITIKYLDDPPFPEDRRFTFKADETNFWLVLDWLTDQDRDIRYVMDPEGKSVSLGGEVARIAEQAQLDRREARFRVRREREDPRLEVSFRPDFEAATVEDVAAVILAQTEVPVLVDPLVWEKQQRITWRADAEMPLRKALDELCDRLDCYYRIDEAGRVFLLSYT